MKPSLGRIVIFKGFTSQSGIKEHAAIITRVWSDELVNITAFIDGMSPMNFSSIKLHSEPHHDSYTWAWPERV